VQLRAFFASSPPDRFPTIVALAEPLTYAGGEDDRFLFGLDILIDGLTAVAAGDSVHARIRKSSRPKRGPNRNPGLQVGLGSPSTRVRSSRREVALHCVERLGAASGAGEDERALERS